MPGFKELNTSGQNETDETNLTVEYDFVTSLRKSFPLMFI